MGRSRRKEAGTLFCVKLLSGEAAEFDRMLSIWKKPRAHILHELFGLFVKRAAFEGFSAENPELFGFRKVRRILSDAREEIAELRMQLQSLAAVQRTIAVNCGARPDTIPVPGLEDFSPRVWTLADSADLWAITCGLERLRNAKACGNFSEISCAYPRDIVSEAEEAFGAEFAGVLEKMFLNLIDLSLAGVFIPTAEGPERDITRMRLLEKNLVAACEALAGNLKRLSGLVEAANKELAEANGGKPFPED